ncbi:hypothetical protein ID866_9519, partial [Astraeus odoratus]
MPGDQDTGAYDNIISLAVSPDGKQVVCGTTDSTMVAWDVERRQHTFPPVKEAHAGIINSVCYIFNGQVIVTASDDQTVRCWNALTGQPREPIFDSHKDGVILVGSVSGTGTIVSLSRDGVAFIWEAQTREVAKAYSVTLDARSLAVLSEDGKKLLVVFRGKVTILDTITAVPLRIIVQETPMILCAAFSRDAIRVVFGLADHCLRTWHIEENGLGSLPLEGHEDIPLYVLWAPDSRTIASVAQDASLRIWDVESMKCVLGPCKARGPIAYSPNNDVIFFPGNYG